MEWIPEVPADVSWLFGMAGDVYRQAWKGTPAISDRYGTIPQRKAAVLFGSSHWPGIVPLLPLGGDINAFESNELLLHSETQI